jgi:hypothetical protein
LTQKIFTLEGKSASADAAGGAHALTATSDELVAAITEWAATTLNEATGHTRKVP